MRGLSWRSKPFAEAIVKQIYQKDRIQQTGFHRQVSGLAFRGRNLPSVMNDGMSLVYVSFTSIVMFTVMFIIVPFQKHSTKEIYQFITVNFSTFITLLLMYTQKAIRMMLHPKKNTKRYFQQKRLMEIRQNADEKLGPRMRRDEGKTEQTNEL